MDSNRHIKLDSGLFLSEIMHNNFRCVCSLIAYCIVMIAGALTKLLSLSQIESKGFNRSILICDCAVSFLLLSVILSIYFLKKKGVKKLKIPF